MRHSGGDFHDCARCPNVRGHIIVLVQIPEAVKTYFKGSLQPVIKDWHPLYRESLTFGYTTTALVEGSHGSLKRHLGTKAASFAVTLQRCVAFIECQTEQFSVKVMQQRCRTPLGILLQPDTFFARKGLDRVIDQAKKAQGARREACSGQFRTQWGLPCSHELADGIRACHPIWLLPLASGDEQTASQAVPASGPKPDSVGRGLAGRPSVNATLASAWGFKPTGRRNQSA